MKINGKFVALIGAFTAISVICAYAQGNAPIARSQLRRTVDPSDRSAFGTVLMRNDGVKQTLEMKVFQLGEDSFSMWLGFEPAPPFMEVDFTNRFVYSVAPLDRVSVRHGNWIRRLTGFGVAPAELPLVSDLSDLNNTHILIGRFQDNKLQQGVTNVVGSTTNIIFGIPLPNAGATGVVSVTMWAPLAALTTSPGSLSYVRKDLLAPPVGLPPPSPGAQGKISAKFTGPTGRSVFDVQASHLSRGQVYHVFISTNVVATVDEIPVSSVLVDAGTMTADRTGANARFLRDTRFGDPLPQQVRDAGDLSGRLIEIRDESIDYVHLIGIVP